MKANKSIIYTRKKIRLSLLERVYILSVLQALSTPSRNN